MRSVEVFRSGLLKGYGRKALRIVVLAALIFAINSWLFEFPLSGW